jgi:hypothetical protein
MRVRANEQNVVVTLSVDSSWPFRSHGRRAELVRAVLGGGEHDETDWLEWKSTLDLGKPEGRFKLARAVLGFSNRSVAAAAKHAEGTAYLVVGASHGHDLQGVKTVDLANLSQALTQYVGSPPQVCDWDAAYVEIDGKQVLVVTVEAPRAGTRIAPLRKALDSAYEGTVYIRSGTSTRPANPAQIDMLQDRLTAPLTVGAPKLDVEVSLETSGDLLLLDDVSGVKVAWLQARLDHLRSLRAADVAAEHAKQASPGFQRIDSASFFVAGPPTIRFTDEEISAHVRECEKAMTGAAIRMLIADARMNTLRVTVSNNTDETVPGIEVWLTLPDRVQGFVRPPRPNKLPTRVSTRQSLMATVGGPWIDPDDLIVANPHRRPGFVEIDDADGKIVHIVIGDVRQHRSVPSEPITLFLHTAEPVADEPAIAYQATSNARRSEEADSYPLSVDRECTISYASLIGEPTAIDR